jgi:rare lipoprotein A
MNRLSLAVILPLVILLFSACSTRGKRTYIYHDYAPKKTYSSNKSNYSSQIDKKTYSHPTMRPYVVRGIRYHPTVVSVGDRFKGNASWYGPDFQGKLTSSGEVYNMYNMTAAHKTLPMNTILKVTNRRNGLSTVVRVNDRGPFISTRIIDLSRSAASKINMIGTGTAPVIIEVLGFESKGKRHIPSKKELKDNPQKQSIEGFALQIASFSKIDGAIATQSKYDNTDGYHTIIKDMRSSGGLFKVWLKGFQSEQEARDYKAQGHFKHAFIVKED